MIPDPEQVGRLIRDVARSEVLPRFRNLASHEISEKAPGDIVTVADEQAERALSERLTKLLPGAGVIGEEQAAKNPDSFQVLDEDRPVWIVDPVDGTQNFADGKSCFAMIVALVIGGETRAGWIYEPVDDRLVWATKDHGAWESGHRLSLPEPPPLTAFRGSVAKRIRERLISGRKDGGPDIPAEMTRYRCVGAEYADLARGALQFARYGGRLKPWDHAAGALIHHEAGGYNALIETGDAYVAGRPTKDLTFLLAPHRDSWYELRDLLSV